MVGDEGGDNEFSKDINDLDEKCDEQGLTEEQCASKKVMAFCGALGDDPDAQEKCKVMFKQAKDGEITFVELEEQLANEFGKDRIQSAQVQMKQRFPS